MATVNVHEAKTHFSRFLAEVERGGEVIIARAGKPVAKLVPFDDDSQPARLFGMLDGQAEELLRVFDEWSEDDQAELEASFYGSPLVSPVE